MLAPEVLRRVKSAEEVEIVCDNAVRPHVTVSESAPVLGISRYPRTLERRRRAGRSSHSSLVENRWGNTTPASPRKIAPFTPRTPDSPETGRSTWSPRGSIAVPENDSIKDIHHSPQQEKMAFTFRNDCLRTPEPSRKMTVTSKPFQKSPTESTISSTSMASPIFNRWDSTPAVYKHLKSEQPSSVLSLRSCAVQTARTHRKPTGGGLFTVRIPDKLHKDPDLILSPPKKPVRRGSFESSKEQDLSESSSTLSDTASMLEEALRITADTQHENDRFGTSSSSSSRSNDTCDDYQSSLPLALPL